MKRTAGILLVLIFVCFSSVYAQDKIQPPIQKKAEKQKKVPTPKPKGPVRLVTLDFPLIPYRVAVAGNRIKNRNIQIGTTLNPWRETTKFKYAFTPRFSYSDKSVHTTLEGGFLKSENDSFSRRDRYVQFNAEGSAFYVLGGVDGFAFYEEALGALKGLKYDSDFSRFSYGGRGYLGFKTGSFHKSFVAARLSRGYIASQGSEHFRGIDLWGTVDFPLYFEHFHVQSVSIENRLAVGAHFASSMEVESNWYERIRHSPDSKRFGLNRFNDVVLRNAVEIIPGGSKHDTIRVVVETFNVFGYYDRLLFNNDPPYVQVMLRIAF